MLTYDLTDGKKSKTLSLYDHVKSDILSGALKTGERLPSKRELAEHLGVSVITVENAYAMLEDEGYIEGRSRVGFFVRELRLIGREVKPVTEIIRLPEEMPDVTASEAERAYFPAMARIVRRLLSERPEILQQKPPEYGCAVLRNAIADYLRRYRGMAVQPSNIIIGSGSEYLYGLVVQFFGRDKRYAIEVPSYKKIEKVFAANGASIDRLKMGPDGILSEELARTDAQILHVTPFHSYPTGVTATPEKRFEYLTWAAERDGYIVEDDYDSEFAFFRKPIDTLYARDTAGRVIYMNTFTRTLSPAVRVAYMILSDKLLEAYEERLGFYSCPVPVLDQYVLASFIDEGGFERHLNRIRRAVRT